MQRRTEKTSFPDFRNTLIAMSAAICMTVAQPGTASAQCEVGANSSAFQAAQNAAVQAAQQAILLAVELERMAASAAVGTAMNSGWDFMKNRLDKFWKDLLQSMKDQTKQLNSGQIDQTRQLAQNFDSSNLQEAARHQQRSEFEAKKQFTVSDEACRFDTTAKYMARNTHLSKAVASGFAGTFNQMGNNKAGTPAASGPAAVQNERWKTYSAKFCDPAQNGGAVPCTGTDPALRNAHITPSKTIFGKETINMDDPDTRSAVNELVFNISGYQVPPPMPLTVQDTATGREQRQINRENLTQMDAVGALVWSAIGERTVGENAPEVQQMRVRAGVNDAAARPSEREIRQSILESLWNPKYYVQLNDAKGTTGQKDVYLKAYSLTLLYKIVDKTEKIANVYAIETANMLATGDVGSGAVNHVKPVK